MSHSEIPILKCSGYLAGQNWTF